MTYELVSVKHGDGLLHGLLARNKRKRLCVVLIHGTAGNFYANPFIEPTMRLYAESGANVLSVNFPGHDETAATERFEDFTPALDGWLDGLGLTGPLLLQGHSLGALKVLAYLQDARARYRKDIQAAALLSPFDIVAFYAGKTDEEVNQKRSRVQSLIRVEGQGAMVPKEIFGLWPLSLGTFERLTAPGGQADQFPTRNGLVNWRVPVPGLPTLVAIGGSDFAAFPSPEAVVEACGKRARLDLANEKLVVEFVAGAPHNFEGKTDALREIVGRWLSRISPQ